MKVEKNDNFDSSRKFQVKNLLIGFSLLAAAIYLINILIRPDISQDIQGFLVVIIGLLLIVAIDFFKKDSNSTISNVRGNYPRRKNNYYYNYTGENLYYNTGNTDYYSEETLQKVDAEMKEIIEKISLNKTDSDVKEMQIIKAELIEKIKHKELELTKELTKELTNKDLSMVLLLLKLLEQ